MKKSPMNMPMNFLIIVIVRAKVNKKSHYPKEKR